MKNSFLQIIKNAEKTCCNGGFWHALICIVLFSFVLHNPLPQEDFFCPDFDSTAISSNDNDSQEKTAVFRNAARLLLRGVNNNSRNYLRRLSSSHPSSICDFKISCFSFFSNGYQENTTALSSHFIRLLKSTIPVRAGPFFSSLC